MELFFVYGTLKSGHRNNKLLRDCYLVGEAKTADNYMLYNMMSFPGAVRSAKGMPIKGELYKVDSLETVDALDRMEGNGHFFTRAKRVIIANEGVVGSKLHVAWIYELPDTRWGMAGYCPMDEEENAYVWK